jgi:hypothetical protein
VEYEWNWLSLPYFACAASFAAVAVVAALVRGDRVLRLGTIGAATTALPWALCSAVATWSHDPDVVKRLLKLGNGPVALVGPSLLLVLLGVSGQLERHRYLARIAGAIGLISLSLCWGTDWVVADVHPLSSGILYTSPGPLTGLHFSQIGIWLAIGFFIVRRTTTGGERRRLQRMLLGVLALGTIGSSDLLLVYNIGGVFPVAWLCAMIAALVALRYELKTDLLRPQGFDRGAAVEMLGTTTAVVIVGVLCFVLDSVGPLALACLATLAWTITLGLSWSFAEEQPVRIARERALETMVASLADVTTEAQVAAHLAALWKPIALEVKTTYRTVQLDEGQPLVLVDIASGRTKPLDGEVARWLVGHGELLAAGDLGTMRVGPIRPMLEALVTTSNMIVPLIDRGSLVGLVEVDHQAALREAERGLVVESARAAARALTYVALTGAAAQEGESAREVEVAEAMRLQASASRDDELGRWTVATEYRSAPRSTGAGWSANLLPDGRLAVLVTEAQAHGVAAALATAALTGAFAAATSTRTAITLEDLLASLNASAEGVIRGGEPVAAFVAIVDGDANTIRWAAAGHPGAILVGPVAVDVSFPDGSVTGRRPTTTPLGGGAAQQLGASLVVAQRGEHAFPADSLLVIASTSVRGEDESTFTRVLADQAPAGSRLASVLVEQALRNAPKEDLLAVVVRLRSDRHSRPIVAPL